MEKEENNTRVKGNKETPIKLQSEDSMKQTYRKKFAVFCFGSVMSGKLFHTSYEATPRKKKSGYPSASTSLKMENVLCHMWTAIAQSI